MQVLCLSSFFVIASSLAAAQPLFEDDFTNGAAHWKPLFVEGEWSCSNGMLSSRGGEEYAGRAADMPPMGDVLMEVEARCGDSSRHNFGLALRIQEDHSRIVVRYYDRKDALEIILFEKDAPIRIERTKGGLGIKPGAWFRFKAAAVGEMVFAKCWPAGGAEPDWQLRTQCTQTAPGAVGLIAHDGAHADFRHVRIDGSGTDSLRRQMEAERKARLAHLREALTLELEPTPFVLREGRARQVFLRPLLDGKLQPVNGTLRVSLGDDEKEYPVAMGDFARRGWAIPLTEPTEPASLRVTFDVPEAKRLEAECPLAPARPWTFYMTPHTHYDIGYTHPQPEIIERLAREMNDAIQFCEETADWPAESRYRWTVEVTSLMDHFIRRYPDQVDRFMRLVREGRIEICGYYLNMPTELTGHEETIRCLYYAQELRERYGVTIDTVMIDDVPGYAWPLADLFVDAGMPRAAFRANSIRGQFLWYREGAVPRPFYWEGPAGKRLFTWYTDSYREGNFFREPGLHEDHFLGIIRRNEAAGTWVSDIQLRMGGDNLPPDIDASKNARAWNEKYLWPRVAVATNREFLEVLEAKHGGQTPVVAGDIPSWWAEGPASTAAETGLTRLVHDQLTSTEALWTLASLYAPGAAYPCERLDRAYDHMLHFDEHTWGASGSITEPHSEATRVQWEWKSNHARQAASLTEELEREALAILASAIPAPGDSGIVVWNSTGAPGGGLVALAREEGFPVSAAITRVVEASSGMASPAQWDGQNEALYFLAGDVPAYGFAIYELQEGSPVDQPPPANDFVLENDAYRLAFSPETGAWTSFYDKRLDRELLDTEAAWRGNQPIREIPRGGREAVDTKQPVDFDRTPAGACRFVKRESGAVYESLTFETSLPGCPRIRQTYRLCQNVLDIENVFNKEEVLEPEAIAIAFPFEVDNPTIRVQIADATMRPGIDQLPYSCYDFYSIQHWASIADESATILWMPLDAPLVSFSDLNMYRWADKLTFDRGHVYSLVMNNCWTTNFRAGQDGEIRFRYRIEVQSGAVPAVQALARAQRAFSPLLAVKPTAGEAVTPPTAGPFLTQSSGESVTVSCIKRAESGDAVIVRLLEQDGHGGPRTFRFKMPEGFRLERAYTATPTETPLAPLHIDGDTVTLDVPARSIVTLGAVLARQ